MAKPREGRHRRRCLHSPARALVHLHVHGGSVGHTGQRLLQVAHGLVHDAVGAAGTPPDSGLHSRRRSNLPRDPDPEQLLAAGGALPAANKQLPAAAEPLPARCALGGKAGAEAGSGGDREPAAPWARSTRSTRPSGARPMTVGLGLGRAITSSAWGRRLCVGR